MPKLHLFRQSFNWRLLTTKAKKHFLGIAFNFLIWVENIFIFKNQIVVSKNRIKRFQSKFGKSFDVGEIFYFVKPFLHTKSQKCDETKQDCINLYEFEWIKDWEMINLVSMSNWASVSLKEIYYTWRILMENSLWLWNLKDFWKQ